MDEADITSQRQEQELAFLLRARRPVQIQPKGACYFCDEPVSDKRLFCDSDCRDDWERRQKKTGP